MTRIAHQELSPAENLKVAGFFLATSFVLFGLIPGGMKYMVLGLAVWLAILVQRNAKEAISASIVYLLACNVLLPPTPRFPWTSYLEPWEMYYWATGLLIITLAVFARIGVGILWRVPLSVRAFVTLTVLAAWVGFAHGNETSYVIRQTYGTVLLITGFAIAYHFGDEQFFLGRLRTFGIVCAVAFFVYYLAVFNEYGFHKEATSLGTLEAAAASICFAEGMSQRRRDWMLAGLIMFAVPFLLFERRAILTFVVALVVALAIMARSRKARFFYTSVAILGMLPALLPSSAEYVLEQIKNNIPELTESLPEGGHDTNSLMERTLQLVETAAILQRSPLVGEGFGAEIGWETPSGTEFKQQAYVDNGWAYLATKMGVLGIIVFTWFLTTVLRSISRRSLGLSACLLAMLLVTMFTEPVFFNFNTSPLLGVMAGLLCARRAQEEKLDSHLRAAEAVA